MDVDVHPVQRIIIKFLVMKGVSDAEIHRSLLAVFKSETLSHSRVFDCLSGVLVFLACVNQSAMMTVLARRILR